MAKTKKADPKLISVNQKYEIYSIMEMLRKFNPGVKISIKAVREVRWMCGRSRTMNYAVLQKMDYKTPSIKLSAEQKRELKKILTLMGL